MHDHLNLKSPHLIEQRDTSRVWLQIPRVRTRLATFKFKFEAKLLLEDAAGVLDRHCKAQKELRSSTCFSAALQRVLVLG